MTLQTPSTRSSPLQPPTWRGHTHVHTHFVTPGTGPGAHRVLSHPLSSLLHDRPAAGPHGQHDGKGEGL